MDFGQDVDEIVRLTKWIMTHAPAHAFRLATQDYSVFGVALNVLESQRTRINFLENNINVLTEHKKEKSNV
jgi:hypothetical protein